MRHIIRPGFTVPPSLPVLEVAERFEHDESLQGLCVVDDGRPVGTVMRHRLHRQLSGRFGFSLFAGKTVASVMDKGFLSVDHQTTIDVVSRHAMRRESNQIYDFVTVTRDGNYAGIVTVRELLEKSIELEVANARQLNPLSELPGNALIDIELERLVRLNLDKRVLYFDIDNFKAYNDKYGFKNGDRVLKRLASIISENTPQGDFVGHIGGDDFIAVTERAEAEKVCQDIISAFAQGVAAYYNAEDFQNGYIEGKNRNHQEERFPLMSLTIVGVCATSFQSSFDLARAAANMKKRCKQLAGNNFMFDDGDGSETDENSA